MLKSLKNRFGLVSVGLFIIFLSSCSLPGEPTYGEKTTYNKSSVIKFPDFNLKYLGQREESVPDLGSGNITYDDFEIEDGHNQETISWSSGTGDIAPVPFGFYEKNYLLEKDMSDIFGQLKDNELVIWEKDDYEQRMFLQRGS